MTMTIEQKPRGDQESTFSFAERELQRAKAAAEIAHKLTVDADSHEASNEDQGSDPYNTSGSFDRKKNWTKVGKR
jgi:hypothetical protein